MVTHRDHMEPFSLRTRAMQSREIYYMSRDHPNAHELTNHIRHPSPAPVLRGSKKMCLLCSIILSVYRLQIMIRHFFSPVFDFCIPIDFGLNDLFSHIFSVLHRNSMETSWFSLVIHESPLTEENTMPSSLDTRISMLTPPVSRRVHLHSQKN